MDTVLAAVSEPHRRALLDALRDGPRSVGELTELVPIAQSGVSRHLRLLRDAGLVESSVEGQRRIYRLHPEPLEQLGEWLEPYRRLWIQRLDALHTEVARGRREEKDR
ncbi:metalloregulator ArsR/SmtB family transcription factor [Microbacterium sp. BWT-B31]|uniref:ArsR/SmtB family transcription factor n=1 Tax=Microbacterium sp. BWT-B31 TaxID=3232072 RepID=UPI00352850C4